MSNALTNDAANLVKEGAQKEILNIGIPELIKQLVKDEIAHNMPSVADAAKEAAHDGAIEAVTTHQPSAAMVRVVNADAQKAYDLELIGHAVTLSAQAFAAANRKEILELRAQDAQNHKDSLQQITKANNSFHDKANSKRDAVVDKLANDVKILSDAVSVMADGMKAMLDGFKEANDAMIKERKQHDSNLKKIMTTRDSKTGRVFVIGEDPDGNTIVEEKAAH